MAAATEVRETPMVTPKKLARVLDGHMLLGEDDKLLAEPEVYYHPQQPNMSSRVVPGQYPLPRFMDGRTVVYTRKARDTVRTILGANADRWKGDTPGQDEDLVCDNCNCVTRNSNVFTDHLKYFKHVPR